MDIPYDPVGDVLGWAETQRRVYPRHSNWASEIGHPCERYLELVRVRWEEIIPPSAETILMFEAGNMIEKHIAKPQLERAGYDVYPGETFVMRDLKISGRLDFKIRKNHGPKIPVEVKGLNHYDFEKINSIEDFLLSKKPWLKKYPGQLLVYMLNENAELGMFYIVSKLTLKPKAIWVNLDYTYAEDLLKRAERVNKKVDEIEKSKPVTHEDFQKYLTPPIAWDDKICGTCNLLHVCQPGRDFGEGAKILDMPDLEDKIDRIKELGPLVSEHRALDKEVKNLVKEQDKLICGKYLITGKWVERDGFTVEATKYWSSKFIPVENQVKGK